MKKMYQVLFVCVLISGCRLLGRDSGSNSAAGRKPIETLILEELEDASFDEVSAEPKESQGNHSTSRQNERAGRYRKPVSQASIYTPAGKVQIDNCRKAILQDNPELLRQAMGDHFEVNCRDIRGETLLQYAVRERKLRSVEYLLSRNAEVNCQDRFGLSPLFLCSRDRDADLADILIKSGAVTSLQEKVSGWNVFHKVAAENTGLRTLSVLMQEKSGLNQQDNQGKTPLHLAVSRTPYADVGVVEYLLRNGAAVNALDNNGCSPMDLTRQRNIVDCLRRHFGRRFKFTNLRDKRTRTKHVYY